MKRCYKDITQLNPGGTTSRKGVVKGDTTEVAWFDEHGVPRYCEFHPDRLDIYAVEAAYMQIKCQNCGMNFMVALCRLCDDEDNTLRDRITNGTLDYGTPPNVECCQAGLSMSSVPIEIKEYWSKTKDHRWERDPVLSRKIIIPDWWRTRGESSCDR